MRDKLLLGAAVVFIVSLCLNSLAWPQTVIAVPTASHGYVACGGGSCTWGQLPNGPRIIHVPPHEIDAERDAKWVKYCDPKIYTDKYGVERYRYAKPGCEFGLTEDPQ